MLNFDSAASTDSPLIIAHRGSSAREHENTIKAFEAAIEDGADGIEIDVRRSSDGVLVVHHDPMVRRGGALISTMTYDEVLEEAARQSYRVPTLEEVVQLCAGRIGLDIELKEAGYEAEVANAAGRMGREQVVFTSFIDEVVQRLKAIAPEFRSGLLLGAAPLHARGVRLSGISAARRLRRTGADFIAPHWRLMRLGIIKRAGRRGLPSVVWTVDKARVAERAVRLGASAIITNDPLGIRRSLGLAR